MCSSTEGTGGRRAGKVGTVQGHTAGRGWSSSDTGCRGRCCTYPRTTGPGMNGSGTFRTANGRRTAPVGTGRTGRRTSDGRRSGRRSGRGAKKVTGRAISTGAAVATTAGITESTADSGSGEVLKHLVRDEPV